MSNTRRTKAAVRISTAFAATALLTVAGAASAQAATDPGLGLGSVTGITQGLPAVSTVTTTVSGLTNNLPLVGSVLGTASGASASDLTDDVPVVGGLLGGEDGLLGGVLGGDDGLVGSVGDDVLQPVLDTVDDTVDDVLDTVGDDVIPPVLHTVDDTVDDVLGTVNDTVDDLLGDDDPAHHNGHSHGKTVKTVVHRHVMDDGDNGAIPAGGVRAGALPHTGASALPLYLLAGGAALAGGGAGLRRFVIRAGR